MKKVRKRTLKVRKYKIKKLLLVVVLLALLLTVFVLAIRATLNYFATDIVTTYLNELTAHDKKSIGDYVDERFETMYMIHDYLRNHHIDSEDSILEELRILAASYNVERFVLIDTDNNAYCSINGFEPSGGSDFDDYFDSTGTYVSRFETELGDQSVSLVLYSISFQDNPVILSDGVRIEKMVMLRDAMYLSNRLNITSFNNRGYTSIVDLTGKFVVKDEFINSLGNYENIFDLLEGSKIEKTTYEEIEHQFKERRAITFWYTNSDKVRKFVMLAPIDDFDLTFITSIEESVYTDQFKYFVQLIAFMMGGLFVICVVGFILLRYSRKSLVAFYSSVADGVHSRQYYNDRVVDTPVKALAIVDIDHLKQINDTYGHLVGDEAIRKMAIVLTQCAGEVGEVCRFGGDEFVVTFPTDISPESFQQIVESVVERVRTIRLESHPDFKMSLSIGAYHGAGIASEIFKKADDLLYDAKKTRDRAVVKISEK